MERRQRHREAITPKTDTHRTTVSERTAVLAWRGVPLANDENDELVLRAGLPVKPGKQYLRVLQECEQGTNDWAAIPRGDQPAFSAAVLDMPPAQASPEHAQ